MNKQAKQTDLPTIWLDPRNGSDTANGSEPSRAVGSFARAWQLAMQVREDGKAQAVNILPGIVPTPHWLEGNALARSVWRAVEPGSVVLSGGLDLARASGLTFENVIIWAGGDHPNHNDNVLHLADSRDVRLYKCTLHGYRPGAKEIIKANQVDGLTIEECQLSESVQTGIDLMVCRNVQVLNNNIFNCDTWGIYAKGGSSLVSIINNQIQNCGFGISAGEGSGLGFLGKFPAFMKYECYGFTARGNQLTNIPGHGLGVQGAFNSLFADNQLENVAYGEAGYGLFYAGFGNRVWFGEPDLAAQVQANLRNGAWGSPNPNEHIPIPARHSWFYNNRARNQQPTKYGHFVIHGTPERAGYFTLNEKTKRLRVDADLRIKGNVIWDGGAEHPLGMESQAWTPAGYHGAQPNNKSANETLIRKQNTFDLDPLSATKLPRAWRVPEFAWDDAPAEVQRFFGLKK